MREGINDLLKVGACGINVFWILDCLKMAILHLKKAIGPILLVGCVVGTGIKQVYMTNMIVTSCVHYALEHINCRLLHYNSSNLLCFLERITLQSSMKT